MKDRSEPAQGIVTETLPNMLYRVELRDGTEIIAYSSGKMRLHKIHVLVGDKVQVILDPAGGKTSNRIIKRG